VWKEIQNRISRAKGELRTNGSRKSFIVGLTPAWGECWLRRPEVSAVVEEALRLFDGQRYLLGHYVVMAQSRSRFAAACSGNLLKAITHSWKSFTRTS